MELKGVYDTVYEPEGLNKTESEPEHDSWDYWT